MFSHLISSCVTQPCPPPIALRMTTAWAKERRRAAAGRAPQILHKYYNSPLHLQSALCLSGDTVIIAYLDSLCVTGIAVQRSSTNNTVHFHLLSNWVRGVFRCQNKFCLSSWNGECLWYTSTSQYFVLVVHFGSVEMEQIFHGSGLIFLFVTWRSH